jgi:RND family efflux transporter MFP subunit
MATAASDPVNLSERKAKSLFRRWVFIVPVALSLAVAYFLNQNAGKPEPVDTQEIARVLRVIEAKKITVAPRAIGYGISMPGQIWQAVAEVRGKIVKIHPDLASGAIIKKDTVLLEIDKRDYELALAVNSSAIEQIKAQLSELSAQEDTTKASLRIEERSLQLAEDALKRKQGLLAQNAIAPDLVEAEERAVLAQRQSVQSLKNTLTLMPFQRQALEANLKSTEAQLAQTRRDLERVTIKAPFYCRLGTVTLEEDQFVAAGQVLFEAYSLKVIEIEARFPPERLRPILTRMKFNTEMPQEVSAMATMRDIFNVSAKVRISGFKELEPWPARFDRVRESVDQQTRTIGIVVAIDEPYKMVIPGRRPLLTKDLFCEVELKAADSTSAIVIPDSAIIGRTVYVLTKESRLEKREVITGFSQGSFVTIESGIRPGEMVVVSDPVPAIEGMLVDPVLDKRLMSRLMIEAGGEGDLK